jgi:hypothetical protein
MEIFKIIIRLFKKIFHIFQKKGSYPESQPTEQENEPSAVIESEIIEEGTYKGAEKEIKEELIGKQEEKEGARWSDYQKELQRSIFLGGGEE